MVRVNRYLNPYTDDFESTCFEEGRIRDMLGEGFDYGHSIILCNGDRVDGDYFALDGSTVCVRTFPAVITTAVVAIGGLIKWGMNGWQGDYWHNGVLALLGDWLKPGSSGATNSESQESEKIPSIKGGKNQSAQGRPVPLVLGKSVMTPYYCGNPYTTVTGDDGDTQYFHVCYVVGYAPLEITDLNLGELFLSENTGKVTDGTIPVSAAQGSAGRFVGNVDLEIRSASSVSPTLYPRKVVQESLDFQLLYPEPAKGEDPKPLKAERFSAAYPEKIQVEISLSALMKQNSSGNLVEADCKVLLGISFDGGATYEPFGAFAGANSSSVKPITDSSGTQIGTGTESVITRCKNKGMRFVAERQLTWQEAVYLHEHGGDVAQIFIQKANTDPVDGKTQDKVFASAIRTWPYDYSASVAQGGFVAVQPVSEQRLREKVVCLAMRVKADNGFADLNGTLNQLTCMAQSMCRTWNGTAWSETLSPSGNPASVALYLMQSPMLGSYAIADGKIDLARFGELYEECETHRGRKAGTVTTLPLRCSGVLTGEKKLFETLNQVLSTGRSCMTMNGTKYSVLIDRPREYPVTVLNNHVFLADGTSNQKSFEKLPDGYEVRFINERLGYAEDSIYVMVGSKASSDPTAVIEKTEMTWVTDPDLVWQATVFSHAKRKFRRESWTRKLGMDGNLIEVGSLVSMQDDTIVVGMGDGGEIRQVLTDASGNITGVAIDGDIGISDLTKTYGVKMFIADGVHQPSVVVKTVEINEEGYHSEFTFDEPIAYSAEIKPAVGDILSFGIYGRITCDALCTSKKDDGKGTFTMTFVPYDERIYSADLEGIPEFNSMVTEPQPMQEVGQIPQEYVKVSDYNTSLGTLVSGSASGIGNPSAIRNLTASAVRDGIEVKWSQPEGGGLVSTISYYVIEISKDGGTTWSPSGKSSDLSYTHTFDRTTDGYPEAAAFATWKVRVTAVNVYGGESAKVVQPVDATGYGTWILPVPTVSTLHSSGRSPGRTFQATLEEPPNANGRILYGNIRWQVQVRRPRPSNPDEVISGTHYDDPGEWNCPATSSNPYGDDGNYRDVQGTSVECSGSYIQVLPLAGQPPEGSQQVENNVMRPTYYEFRFRAVSDAPSSKWSQWSSAVGFTATIADIYDFVRANKTVQQEVVESLSAISANLGEITQGSMSGNNTNYWTLTTKHGAQVSEQDPDNKSFEGAFRVGNAEQGIKVVPIVRNGVVVDYFMTFKAGQFEISSTTSKLQGNLIVQDKDDSLERALVSPDGIYFQTRETPSSDEWTDVARQNVSGTLSKMLFSTDSMVISTQDIAQRRASGLDIGYPYLSANARVYHFDDIMGDQNGDVGYTLSYPGEPPSCVGKESNGQYGDIDFSPAIRSVAPYAEIGRSLYGMYSLTHELPGTVWTCDFWIQYLWAENQILFEVHCGDALLRLGDRTLEPNYNEPAEGEPFYNTESDESVLMPYNVARDDYGYVSFEGGSQKREVPLPDLGIKFETGMWLHIAAVRDGDSVTLMLASDGFSESLQFSIDMVRTADSVTFNPSRGSFLLDELYIDSVAEGSRTFGEISQKRIPWGSLDGDSRYFIMAMDPRADFATNIPFARHLVMDDADFSTVFPVAQAGGQR